MINFDTDELSHRQTDDPRTASGLPTLQAATVQCFTGVTVKLIEFSWVFLIEIEGGGVTINMRIARGEV